MPQLIALVDDLIEGLAALRADSGTTPRGGTRPLKNANTLASLLVAASVAPSDSGDLKPIGTREAPAAQGLPPGHPPIGPAAPAGPASDRAQGSVSGTVALSPKLSTGAGDVLYLIAKQGPTTLAVRRIDKPSFPLDFELTGADAMVSGVAFVGPVDIVARVSRTGDAIPTKGDLEGGTKGVAVPASGVRITIDTTRP